MRTCLRFTDLNHRLFYHFSALWIWLSFSLHLTVCFYFTDVTMCNHCNCGRLVRVLNCVLHCAVCLCLSCEISPINAVWRLPTPKIWTRHKARVNFLLSIWPCGLTLFRQILRSAQLNVLISAARCTSTSGAWRWQRMRSLLAGRKQADPGGGLGGVRRTWIQGRS